jgi:hypothetical protein
MTKKGGGKFGRLALSFLPIPIVAVGFLVGLWWLKPSRVIAEVLTAVAVIVVMGYSGFVGKRQSEQWDEVQRAGWGFGSAHAGWGFVATMLLLMVPPVMNWLVNLVNAVVEHAGHHRLSPDMANHVAVQLAFWFGIMLLTLMQTLASVVATIVWWRRMGTRIW